MPEGDRLGIGIWDPKVKIGIDIRVQVQLALFDELHHGGPREQLGKGTNLKDRLFGINPDLLLKVGVPVAGGDVIVRVAQRLHPLLRHPRADRVVVVERGALARLEAARARLADVVEQRRQSHPTEIERRTTRRLLVRRPHVLDDGDRVRQHVLVAVDRVVLQAHGGEFGQELIGQPGLDEEPQPRCGVIDEVLEVVPEENRDPDGTLPECSIRMDCRWFSQVGAEACRVCPQVITDTRSMATAVDQEV